jgi:CysZ protein
MSHAPPLANPPPAPAGPSRPPSHPNPVVFGQIGRREDFRTGVRALVVGARVLATTPRLWKYTFFSICIACIVTVLLLSVAFSFHGRTMDWLGPANGGWWAWVRPIVWILLAIAYSMAAVALGSILSSITAAPFHDRLSERVEETYLGAVDTPFVWTTFAGDVLQGIAHSLLNLSVYLPLSLLCLAMNLVPGIGSVVAWIAGTVLTGAMLSLELTDFPQARRRFHWREKVGLLRREFPSFLGFGLSAALLLAIPFMSLVLAPIGVVGGTLLFGALDRAGRVPWRDRRLP